MKALFIFFVSLFSAFSHLVFAQSWTQLNSGVNDALLEVFFVNSDTGFTSGANGVILKTIDGGANWLPQNSGVNDGLVCIQFVNNNIGYASGGFAGGAAMNCRLIKTTNSGANWLNVVVAPSKCGGGSFFLNADTGFYAYADTLYGGSSIAKTTNGGANWTVVHTDPGWISFFDFVDDLHGFATVSNGTVLKTTDGGQSWAPLSLPDAIWASGLHFFNQDTGLVGGGPPNAPTSMFKTLNAGQNWVGIPSSSMIYKIFFADQSNGFALTVDTTGAGELIKSTNAGNNWVNEPTPSNKLRGIYFLNSSLGYVAGDSGVILKYSVMTNLENPKSKVPEFSIYPNPAGQTIHLIFSEPMTEITEIHIFNSLGEVVKTTMIRSVNVPVSVEELANGMYLVEVQRKGMIGRLKILIQK